MNEQQNYPAQQEQPQFERIVSVSEWLKLMLISLLGIIPFIGWIIMLVIYIVKATDTRLPQSYRNLIKAGFIWVGICIAISILLVIFIAAYGLNSYLFNDAMNSFRYYQN